MIIVDRALQERAARNDPIRVGMVGAGFMGRGIANQIVNSVPGMTLAAVANRTLARARQAYEEAGAAEPRIAESVADVEGCVAAGQPAITEDPLLLCRAGNIDAIVEVTGAVELGAAVVMEAIAHGKHVILMNAELDATVGPLLKVRADQAGVVYTACDGDQPGVEMNLYRFVRSIGLTPLVCGNIKGLQDRFRNPTTQQGFAAKWGQNPWMVTSFADGTKISCEQAIVANGTGMRVSRRGMNGWEHSGHVDELVSRYDVDELRAQGGIVDYVVGARPGPGVFVLAAHDDARQRHYLNLYKLGEGPLYSFYTPYHLCHFEVPLSVARAVLFQDAVLAPQGPPVVEVITRAKRPLRAGEAIDGIGGYTVYGECENADASGGGRLLPIGVAEGCVLVRDVPIDEPIRYDDVELPEDRLIDRLRMEQDQLFSAVPSLTSHPAPALS